MLGWVEERAPVRKKQLLDLRQKVIDRRVQRPQPGHTALYLGHQTHQAVVTKSCAPAQLSGRVYFWVTLMKKPALRKPTVDP